MTIIEPLAPPGTVAGANIGYAPGSTSNQLLPKIAPALLPPVLAFTLLTGGPATTLQFEAFAPAQTSIVQEQAAFTMPTGTTERAEEVLPELAKSMRSLRRRSGLTWDELARILGVSRRTLYNWSVGGQISAAHARILADIVGLIHEVDTGDPKLTRSRLLAPTNSGSTLYTQLVQRRRFEPQVSDLTYRPDQLLGARYDIADQTGVVTDFEPLD